jgi:hypothetical protein
VIWIPAFARHGGQTGMTKKLMFKQLLSWIPAFARHGGQTGMTTGV